jgi:DNA-binding NarL/FixJ family response regulator
VSIEKPHILFISLNNEHIASFLDDFQAYFTIHTAKSFVEAIELIKKQSVSIIIAEQDLGDITGVQFFEAIISEFPDPIRMLINVSGDADALIQAINKAHIYRSIEIPWDINEFKQSLDTGIKIYQLSQRNRAYIYEMQQATLKSERLINLFRKCVPESVANDALNNPESMFNGEKRHLTVLYLKSNLKDVIKDMSPSQALTLLQDYFEIISKTIERHKGIINKIIDGDTLVFFGAPVAYLHNRTNAVFAALFLVDELKKFNQKLNQPVPIEIGIGIKYGEAILGNIGSDQFLSYNAVGDIVTLAKALSSKAQHASLPILTDEAVYQAANQEVEFEQSSDQIPNQNIIIYQAIAKKVKIGSS